MRADPPDGHRSGLRGGGSAALCVLCGVACTVAFGGRAAAQSSFHLQSTAYGRADPGTALLMMQADGQAQKWISAEALVWGGYNDLASNKIDGDVLVMAIRMRDPGGHGQLRLGRFVVAPGALRPIQIDGADGLVRLPGDFRLEAFGGIPVAPQFDESRFNWTAGGRISRALGDWGAVGVAWASRREGGELSDQEIGVDGRISPADWLDMAGRMAYSVLSPGLAELLTSAVFHHAHWRTEAFYRQRSPSRFLPATSLFSVLGDVPSRLAGASFDDRLAPRLDLSSTAGVRFIGSSAGASLRLRLLLRLDDQGKGAIAVEGRREAAPDGNWTGVRLTARVPIIDQLVASTELELAAPDNARGRGKVWPWGLVGLTWEPSKSWEIAAAVQASASPQYSYRTDALVRVTHRLSLGGGT